MQCFVYCRVSTEEQATDAHYSLANQDQKARDYAKLKGWQVALSTKDVASGKDAIRVGYQELLSAIKRRRVDCVLVYRLDRLSRNVRDIYDFLDLIKEHDVAFVSLSEGFDTTTAMGRAMLGVAAVFAQLTREMIAENVKDGLMRRAQQGLYSGNQFGPYGYQYHKERNTLIPVPGAAELVREIFTLFAERKWGAFRIASYLNNFDIESRTGKQWSTERIRAILRQPAYVGKIMWHDQVFDGKHEPIIPKELWDQAQELIRSRKRIPSRTHQSQHLLSGIAECGDCGRKLTAHHGQKKKDGTRYVFYSHYTDVQRGACRAFHRSADKLERLALDEIGKAASTGVLQRLAAQELSKQLEKEGVPLLERRQTITSELAGLSERFNKWADRLDRGLIDESQFTQQNKRLLTRKSELSRELQEIDLRLAEQENVQVSLEAAQEALEQFPKVWEHLEIQERRELLRQLIERLQVYGDKMVLKLVFSPEVGVAV